MNNWCKLPKELFGRIGTRNMVLLSILIDRDDYATRNGWTDSNGEVIINYTVREACESLGCSKPTAIKSFRVLETEGYIRRVRHGHNKPDSIYVNGAVFSGSGSKDTLPPEVKQVDSRRSNPVTTGGQEISPLEVKEVDHRRSKEFTTGSKESLPPEVKEVDRLYNKTVEQDSITRQEEQDSSTRQTDRKEKPNENREDWTDGFERWFLSYPRRNCTSLKAKTRAEYLNALETYTAAELQEALDNYATELRKSNTPQQYICLPNNFLKSKIGDYGGSQKSEQRFENGVCYTGYGEQVSGYWLIRENGGVFVYSVLYDGRVSRDVIENDGNVFQSPDGRYWCNTADNPNPFMSVCFATYEEAVAAAV